jgi:uncharacterized membrane protein YraQ (UPF0718 family)
MNVINEVGVILEFVLRQTVKILPLFSLTVFLSLLVRSLNLDQIIRKAFQHRMEVSILMASLVGAFSPFCSCTVIPVVNGLLMSGVPLAPVMAFWIASPLMDPEIFTLSIGILGLPLATARLVSAVVLSLMAGGVTWFLTRKQISGTHYLKARAAAKKPSMLLVNESVSISSTSMVAINIDLENTKGQCGCDSASSPVISIQTHGSAACCAAPAIVNSQGSQFNFLESLRNIDWNQFTRQLLVESVSLGRWLLVAFALEAIIGRYVPQNAIANWLGGNNFWEVPLAALIGVPLYINNAGALPIVAALLQQGLQAGAVVAFLIAGPTTTIPAMTAVFGIMKKRVFALYLAIVFVGAILMGWMVNWIGVL